MKGKAIYIMIDKYYKQYYAKSYKMNIHIPLNHLYKH